MHMKQKYTNKAFLPPEKFILFRIFSKEEHAKALLDGLIRMHSLHYYTTLEENEKHKRSDENEGLIKKQRKALPDNASMTNIKIEMQKRLAKESAELRKIYCFCMFLLNDSGSIKTATLSKKDIEKLKDFGNFAVLFKNPQYLIKKLDEYCLDNDIVMGYSPIKYVRSDNEEERDEFCKENTFKYQREFRIKLLGKKDGQMDMDEPFIINIGDLSNIAELHETEKLLNAIQNKNLSLLKK